MKHNSFACELALTEQANIVNIWQVAKYCGP